MSSIFFNQPVVTTVTANSLPTSQLITVTDTTAQSFHTNPTYATENFSAIPHQPFKGTLNWANFTPPPSSFQQGMNPFASNNPFHSNFHNIDDSANSETNSRSEHHLLSKTPPPSFGMTANNRNPEQYNQNAYENVGTLQRTKSMPNLQEQMHDYENLEQISLNNNNMPGVVKYKSDTDSPQSQMQQPVATGRIENIMKQYQFQRIAQTSSPNNHLPMNTGTYVDSTPHQLYDSPPSRDHNNTSNYHSPPFSNQSSVNTLSGIMLPPAYMAPTTNNDYVNFLPNSSTVVPNNHPNSSISTFSSNNSGPMVVNSRLPISNIGQQQYNNSINMTTNSDSVINLNPDNSNRLHTNHHQPQQLPSLSSNAIYSVPTFGSGPTTSADNPPPLPYPRQPFAGPFSPAEPARPPKRPASAKLDVSVFKII